MKKLLQSRVFALFGPVAYGVYYIFTNSNHLTSSERLLGILGIVWGLVFILLGLYFFFRKRDSFSEIMNLVFIGMTVLMLLSVIIEIQKL